MNPAADIWAKVLALMQNEMTTTTINTWFDDTTAVELEGDRFVLYSPTPFKRDIIASRYLPAIQNALRELFSAEFQVTVLTEGELDRYQQPKKNDLIPGTEEYTFEHVRPVFGWQFYFVLQHLKDFQQLFQLAGIVPIPFEVLFVLC